MVKVKGKDEGMERSHYRPLKKDKNIYMCQGHLERASTKAHVKVCTHQRAFLFAEGRANKHYNFH
jgi:hypothetical protein